MPRFEGRVRLAATAAGEETRRTASVFPRRFASASARVVTPSRVADEWVASLRRQGLSPVVRVEGEYLVVSAN